MNDRAKTAIYSLSLHDALPIFTRLGVRRNLVGEIINLLREEAEFVDVRIESDVSPDPNEDRKSTRLNSSHTVNSYAVFCLKKKTDDGNESRPSASDRRCGRRNE